MKIDAQAKVPTNGRNHAESSPNSLLRDADDRNNAVERIQFGPFVIDFQRGALCEGNREINLRPKTFAFLCHLVRNPGRLVSKEELLATIWPNVVVGEDSLVQCVTELRRALSDQDQRLIKTVQKRGYRFETDVLIDPPTEGSPPGGQAAAAAEVQKADAQGGRAAWIYLVAGAATASLFVALVAGLWWNGQHASPGPRAAPPLSIVVLPFANLSDDPSHEFLAAGITTDLTGDLSRIPGLLVIGQATSQTFKGRQIDARAISQELNVRYVLDGNVRQNGDEIRLAIQLIDGDTGMTRWAERFDRKRAQLSEWQDEVVGRIAIALDYKLTMLESERVLRERPNSPEAFDLTARGWAIVYAAKTPENYEAARALFVQAIERDPRAINARAGIAWSLGILVLNGWSKSVEQDAEMARMAVAELLALDQNHVIAHHVRGFLLRVERRTEAAMDAFAAAVAINPNFAPSHAQLGQIYLELGRPDDAIKSAERAIRLSPRDPNSPSWFAGIGMANVHLGRDSDAIPWLARAIEAAAPVAVHQAYYVSALALAGRVDEASVALAQFRKQRPAMTIGSFKASARSVNPIFAEHRQRMYAGLRMAGLPD